MECCCGVRYWGDVGIKQSRVWGLAGHGQPGMKCSSIVTSTTPALPGDFEVICLQKRRGEQL